jgi:hypothetical protein
MASLGMEAGGRCELRDTDGSSTESAEEEEEEEDRERASSSSEAAKISVRRSQNQTMSCSERASAASE